MRRLSLMDMDHQEQEVKLTILDEQGLSRLIAHLGEPQRTLAQVNEYFDTSALELRARRVMLRVRRQGDQLIVTTKSDTEILVGGLRCREIEHCTSMKQGLEMLGTGLAQWDIPPVKHALSYVSGEAVFKSLGSAANVRRVYPYADNAMLEVDRTVLPDGSIHAEIELETTEMSRCLAELRALLERLDIPYTDVVVPKFQRFLDSCS